MSFIDKEFKRELQAEEEAWYADRCGHCGTHLEGGGLCQVCQVEVAGLEIPDDSATGEYGRTTPEVLADIVASIGIEPVPHYADYHQQVFSHYTYYVMAQGYLLREFADPRLDTNTQYAAATAWADQLKANPEVVAHWIGEHERITADLAQLERRRIRLNQMLDKQEAELREELGALRATIKGY